MKPIAAGLILLGVLRHYGWPLSGDYGRFVWNISGAVVIVLFLWALAVHHAELRLIALWWTFEELQVIACSLGRMLRTWQVAPMESQCSSLLGFDLGSVGLFLVALILVCQPTKVSRFLGQRK